MKEMIKELLDRTRRIETKLSRFLAGEPDKATKCKVETWDNNGVCEVEVNSMSVSLQAVIDAARTAGCGADEFLICDNGKPRLIVREIKGETK